MRLIDADDFKLKIPEMSYHCEHDYAITTIEIDAAPTVDASPVVWGRWLLTEEKIDLWRRCSVCRYATTDKSYNYCPNCGAKMKHDF